MNEKTSVLFYKSFRDAAKELPSEQQLEFYEAIMDYGLEGIEPEGSGIIKALFAIVKPLIDSSSNRYTACVENGRKGGRPKNQNETKEKPKENQSETRTKPNPNLNDNDNDNDKYKDNDNVNVNDKDKDKGKGDDNGDLVSTTAAPTLGEISVYFVRIGSKADPQKFYDYYGEEALANMDWKAKAEEWKKTQYQRQNSTERILQEWLKESQENSSET